MFRILKRLVLVALVLAVAGIAVVNILAVPLDELPPPDPSMVISMPDAPDRTLGELVALSEQAAVERANRPAKPAPEALRVVDVIEVGTQAAGVVEAGGESGVRGTEEEWAAALVRSRAERYAVSPDGSDLMELADYKRYWGKPEEAAALLRSIPEDHPQYARAMRKLGWHIYADDMDDPARGVAFVHLSLEADPFDGNGWQDAMRVYARGLGIDVD